MCIPLNFIPTQSDTSPYCRSLSYQTQRQENAFPPCNNMVSESNEKTADEWLLPFKNQDFVILQDLRDSNLNGSWCRVTGCNKEKGYYLVFDLFRRRGYKLQPRYLKHAPELVSLIVSLNCTAFLILVWHVYSHTNLPCIIQYNSNHNTMNW